MKRNLMGGLVATLVTASALAVAPLAVQSANADSVVASAPGKDDPHKRAHQSAQALVSSRAPQLKVSGSEKFVAEPVISGGAGLQFAPYTRTYEGLPVRGGDFVVVTNRDGQILDTTVAQKRAIGDLAVTPKVAAASATTTAKATLSKGELRGTPELVVHALTTPQLAWKVTISGLTTDGDRSVRDIYVDAVQGDVVEADELVHFATGTGNGHHNGPGLALETTQGSGTYSMADPNTPGIDCRIDNNATTNVPVLSGPDNVWGDGTGLSKETGCVDALYALQTQDKMLSQWLGRDGFNGTGGGWQTRVGKDEVNAFYCPPGLSEPGYCNGTEWVRIGHNQANTEWVTNLDVMGHEYGHGIDQNTPGGHSGGQSSEFVGDVFGALTEHFANESSTYDEPDYLVGEEVNLVGDGEIRNMYNPSAKGDPNCYSSSIPNTEVHSAAGPGNHWFYLLAEGTNPVGKPSSTTCNSGGTLTGIGIQKAGKIFYNAMLMKTSSSNYLKYRTWTLTAAKNLYPGSCAEFNAVKAAWNAVSVPAQTADPTCTTAGNTVTVTNPGNRTGTVGTATSLQLTGSSSGAGQTLTWSATGLPAGLSINASSGLISGTPTTAVTASVTVTARDTTGATGSTSFTWTISGGGTPSGNLLKNPGFESGFVDWTGTSGPITNNTGRPARTGTWKMWLGGNGSTSTENENQSVSIPATATTASLTFWVRIDTAETTGSTAYDTAKVQIVSGTTTSTLATYSNLNKSSSYVQKTFDLSAYKGKTVTLKFLMNEDSSLQTSFVIDDTAINVG
ncbi:M4 family metallopeptidase [Nocardioides sp. WS12]|uniref:M4 family metallopeptidase n=1 Tax=Nocardioides sp. WS12 TaxID=2486272 RepID=UPI001F017960|nr:M4 family metallopeptidase [Nocardioides sp. WS12]